MFNIVKKEIEWAGRKLVFETGKIARQADGAVMVTYGETIVLATAVANKKSSDTIDFFPLVVDYQEKYYAAGKIPGGYFKREGKSSEREVLTSRLIDRPIRPLFPEDFHNEVQVICTVLSYDLENDPDIVAIVAASAALAIAGLPFKGPISAARVGYKDGNYILNPLSKDITGTDLDLVVAGTENSVLMVESEASELSEDIMLGAVEFGHKEMQPIIKLINELKQEAGKELWYVPSEVNQELKGKIKSYAYDSLKDAYKIREKQARRVAIDKAKGEAVEKLIAEGIEASVEINSLLSKLEEEIVRGDIINNNMRIDGRDSRTIRPISTEVSLLPKTHGSGLFTRGETQALVVTTLGTPADMQMMDSLDGDSSLSFMLHYNFPPYSVGEVKPLRGPGRREVGHGKLAWRSIKRVLPDKAQFPYTIRVVSEITESNGSSSMATVCGTSLSMMDAGVPIKSMVAGIAMGLVKENEKYVILSDIMGDEDHLGDMDFKVAGTKKGVTALQMDIKIDGITIEIMKNALAQAKDGRMHILSKMSETLDEARSDLSPHAPTIVTMTILKDKIREVIGSGGKVIKDICEQSKAKIDITDEGVITIGAVGAESLNKAKSMIENIVFDPEIGKIYEGKVTKIVEFGAFVNFMGAKEGLVHISEITGERVEKVEDVLAEGEIVKVRVLGIDNKGKVKLSIKSVLEGDNYVKPESDNYSKGNNKRDSRDRDRDRDRDRRDNKYDRHASKSDKSERSDKPSNDRENTKKERKYFN